MKKALCLILSMIIALSTMSVFAFAASVPEISLKTDVQTVRKGDTVNVTVKVSKNSEICAATINFLYDKDCFSVESAEVNGSLGMEFVNESAGNGTVKYVVANDSIITSETNLFTVELKVKKPNGKLSLAFDEVWIDNGGETENITAKVKAKSASVSETVLACRHDFKETVLSQPTCIKDGVKTQECKICGQKNGSTPIKAKGHSLKTVTTQPTCEKDGKKYDECTVCGWKSAATVLKATGHTPGEWETVKEPTETETGKRVKKCTVCGKTVREQIIPAVQKEPVKGDVDGDGKRLATDARMILRHVAGLETLTLSQLLVADVNGDYRITATDARMILRDVAGLEAIK